MNRVKQRIATHKARKAKAKKKHSKLNRLWGEFRKHIQWKPTGVVIK